MWYSVVHIKQLIKYVSHSSAHKWCLPYTNANTLTYGFPWEKVICHVWYEVFTARSLPEWIQGEHPKRMTTRLRDIWFPNFKNVSVSHLRYIYSNPVSKCAACGQGLSFSLWMFFFFFLPSCRRYLFILFFPSVLSSDWWRNEHLCL